MDNLDADGILERMEREEQEGTRFMNVAKKDKPRRYAAPLIAAAVMFILMAGLVALIIWGFCISPEEAPPLAVILILAAIPIIIVGVLLALVQRLKQIKGGEEDAASQY